jgi:hypothetical protein
MPWSHQVSPGLTKAREVGRCLVRGQGEMLGRVRGQGFEAKETAQPDLPMLHLAHLAQPDLPRDTAPSVSDAYPCAQGGP